MSFCLLFRYFCALTIASAASALDTFPVYRQEGYLLYGLLLRFGRRRKSQKI
jgi:hypothetical protein